MYNVRVKYSSKIEEKHCKEQYLSILKKYLTKKKYIM